MVNVKERAELWTELWTRLWADWVVIDWTRTETDGGAGGVGRGDSGDGGGQSGRLGCTGAVARGEPVLQSAGRVLVRGLRVGGPGSARRARRTASAVSSRDGDRRVRPARCP